MAEIVDFPGGRVYPRVATGQPAPPLAAATAHSDGGTSPAFPSLPTTGGRRGEYALADVARPLGLLAFAPRTIIDHLRVLAKHDGMPLPRTPRVVNHQLVRGPQSICKTSRWDAGEIDAWLDSRGGNGPTSPAPAMLPPPIRQEMARRAAGMGR